MTDDKFWTQDLWSQTTTNAIVKPLDHMLFLLLTPPPPKKKTKYILTLIKHFSCVWYVIPRLKTGALASTCNFFVRVDHKNLEKFRGRFDWLQLLATILAQWWSLLASYKAPNLLYWAMQAVLHRRTAAAIEMASHFGTFFCDHFVCCCPGRRWGNTEQVVARSRRPVASGVALDMLHWAMRFVSHQQTAMAIKMANNRGTCWCHCRFCHRQ